MSLYGMTKETYERVTRVPGSFEKCLAGIRRLHARGLPLKLKTMALVLERPRGRGHARLRRWAGLPFNHDSLLNARVDCGAEPAPRAAARRGERR